MNRAVLTVISIFSSAAATMPAGAQNLTIDTLCNDAQAASGVKKTIREKMMPSGLADAFSQRTFDAATHVEGPVTTRKDPSVRTASCKANLTVDASRGLDPEIDRTLQLAFANDPAGLAALPSLFSGPANARRFNVPITYSVQFASGKLLVNVVTISPLQSMLTAGLVKAYSDKAGL